MLYFYDFFSGTNKHPRSSRSVRSCVLCSQGELRVSRVHPPPVPRDLAQVVVFVAFCFAVAASGALKNELQVLGVVFLPVRHDIQPLGPLLLLRWWFCLFGRFHILAAVVVVVPVLWIVFPQAV